MTRAARENSTSHFRRSLHGLLGALALGALASPVCAQTLITPEHGYVGRSPGDGSTPRPKGQEVYEQFLESQRKSSEATKTLMDRIQRDQEALRRDLEASRRAEEDREKQEQLEREEDAGRWEARRRRADAQALAYRGALKSSSVPSSGKSNLPATPGDSVGAGVLASSMPSFDDLLLRRTDVPAATKAGPEGARRWDSALIEATGVATSATDKAERLARWGGFLAETGKPGSESSFFDRALFAAGEWNSLRSGPSAFAVSRSLEAIKFVQSDTLGRLSSAFDAFDSGDELAMGRATDFSSLGAGIGFAMCPWCQKAVTAHASMTSSFAQLASAVKGKR